MHPDQFLAELGLRLHLGKLTFNDESVCRLVLDKQFVVDLEWLEGPRTLHVHSVLCPRASELAPRFTELLSANLFGRGTNGAVLGLDPDRDQVLLHRSFSLDRIDLDDFVPQLDRFIETVVFWTRRLAQEQSESLDDDSPTVPDPDGAGLLRV